LKYSSAVLKENNSDEDGRKYPMNGSIIKASLQIVTLIDMAAPRRSAPRRMNVQTQGLLAKANIPTTTDSIFTDSKPTEQPMVIRAPGDPISNSNRAMMKFSQLIMMCIALAAIWGGLFQIAFADDATNSDFLILFLGGLLSAGIAIGWIEAQSKKNDHVLYEVQDYMLGIGFFFATVGTIWGSRWVIGFVTGEGWTELFGSAAEFNAKGWIDGDTGIWVDWHPNAKAIYVQTAAMLALIFAEIQLLKRFKGATGFGRAVAAYSPILVLLAAGMGPWMKWTDNIISYEMGLSLILLCFAAMEMALRSNKALNFVVVAVVSGFIPIIFEVFNTNAESNGAGGAISLLIFIIAIQGYYASRQELRSELIQKASIVLVGEIVFAMYIARIENLNLHLGPIKSTELGIENIFGLSVALWVAVLIFYFPAVQQRRVPWMPIGLAAALVMLPNDGSMVPWAITLLMVPYMLFIAKATRRWVADYTFSALALAYFFTDLFANFNNTPLSETFGFDGMQVIIPIALFCISEFARQNDKISPWTHLVMLGSLVLSRTILQAEDWFMPWIFIAYMLYLSRSTFSRLSMESPWEEKMQATLVSVIAFVSMTILALLDRIEVPASLEQIPLPEYFNYQIFIIGALGYWALYASREIELDLGLLFNWTKRFAISAPLYDPETNSWNVANAGEVSEREDWVEKNSWSQLTRISLLIPFFMMSFSLITMVNPWGNEFDWDGAESLITDPWALLLLFPIIGLVLEIKNMEIISSVVRSAGVWVLFTIALPLSVSFNILRSEMQFLEKYQDTTWVPIPIMYDIILLSAPLYVNWLITKRGIDEDHLSVNADAWAMLGLLGLACLDTSGGLLIISMLGLVTVRCVKHRHVWPLMLSPIALFIVNSHWLDSAGIARYIIEMTNPSTYDFAEYGFLSLTQLGGIFITLQMVYVLIMDNKYVQQSENGREPMPWFGVWGWALVGVISASSSVGWIPAILFAYLIINSWMSGKLETIVALHIGFMFSLLIGMGYEEIFDEFSMAFSWSALLTACSALTFTLMDGKDLLFKYASKENENELEQEKKEVIVNTLYITTYVFFILSFEALLGLGTLAGAVLLTRDIITKGYANALFFVPAIHAIALANLIIQLDIDSIPIGIPIGLFLLIEGISISWLSLQNDKMYEFKFFNWNNDEEFLDFLDRLGMAGVLSALAGIFFTFGELDQWSLAWMLTTVVLIAIGIQGYAPEHEARWRRIFGGYGSILSFVAFSIDIDSTTMQALSFVGVGLIALGWGFLTMQRLDDDDGIYEVPEGQHQVPQATVQQTSLLAKIPEPVLEEVPEVVEEDEEVPEVVEEDEEVPEVVEEDEEVPEVVEEVSIPMPETISTTQGFEIRLPPGKLEAILKSIAMTPHEGYKPVVGLNSNGQIVIDWVSI
jgi:drug/metabolite transporter superfamily protein YnfA